ncbi:unnamed protein product [Caenorhabditis auriculariae]|uniref:glucuronosyltransferase n=1 Tax=Caenorhabditis auriculariae TaxID=2777116 RepID=A0A8S1HCW1_9PELO|nr:unnamed protein product [Caenorhabditis auriculariae]
MKLLFYIFASLQIVSAHKIAIFVPDVSNSQVIFNQRVAATLASDNHDVTMIFLHTIEGRNGTNLIRPEDNVKTYSVNIPVFSLQDMADAQQNSIFEESEVYEKKTTSLFSKKIDSLIRTAEETVQQKEFIEWLKNEKFDLAFVHMFSLANMGLVHLAKIPSWIWLSSGSTTDFTAHLLGAPMIPSYVPTMMMECTGEMTFIERTKSFIGHGLMQYFWPKWIADEETRIFRQYIDPNFPSLLDIARQTPLAMSNTNDLYELARPTLAKIINIGGIGMQKRDAKPLPEDIAKIVAKSNGTILFSFGSVTAADVMPLRWKKELLEAFSRFPNVQFLMRYPADDLNEMLPKNVHVRKWLPQADLLVNEKLKAFITHAGYNSIQEVMTAGAPVISIPLFGDQPKNARLAEKHGLGITIKKSELSADVVENAIRTIIEDDRYKESAQKMSKMLEKQPIKPDQLLKSWTRFAAEFKDLSNLTPAGQKLNLIQYHSLDVIAFLSSILGVSLTDCGIANANGQL